MLLIHGRDRRVSHFGNATKWADFYGLYESMEAFKVRVQFDKRNRVETVFVAIVKEMEK